MASRGQTAYCCVERRGELPSYRHRAAHAAPYLFIYFALVYKGPFIAKGYIDQQLNKRNHPWALPRLQHRNSKEILGPQRRAVRKARGMSPL